MFLDIERIDAAALKRIWIGEPLPRPAPEPAARSEHARMLRIAAARRLRAQERAQVGRLDDAAYWKAVAPAAMRRARHLRERLAPLPG